LSTTLIANAIALAAHTIALFHAIALFAISIAQVISDLYLNLKKMTSSTSNHIDS